MILNVLLGARAHTHTHIHGQTLPPLSLRAAEHSISNLTSNNRPPFSDPLSSALPLPPSSPPSFVHAKFLATVAHTRTQTSEIRVRRVSVSRPTVGTCTARSWNFRLPKHSVDSSNAATRTRGFVATQPYTDCVFHLPRRVNIEEAIWRVKEIAANFDYCAGFYLRCWLRVPFYFNWRRVYA